MSPSRAKRRPMRWRLMPTVGGGGAGRRRKFSLLRRGQGSRIVVRCRAGHVLSPATGCASSRRPKSCTGSTLPESASAESYSAGA